MALKSVLLPQLGCPIKMTKGALLGTIRAFHQDFSGDAAADGNRAARTDDLDQQRAAQYALANPFDLVPGVKAQGQQPAADLLAPRDIDDLQANALRSLSQVHGFPLSFTRPARVSWRTISVKEYFHTTFRLKNQLSAEASLNS